MELVKCLMCGDCCTTVKSLSVVAEQDDINRWGRDGRADIIARLMGIGSDGCPMLINGKCSIHDTKPNKCRASMPCNTRGHECGGYARLFNNGKKAKVKR